MAYSDASQDSSWDEKEPVPGMLEEDVEEGLEVAAGSQLQG